MKSEEIRVLLVDDEADFLDQAITLLKKLDQRFVIETSETVESALESIEKNGNIDAVVSDYHMPEKDGIEFLRILREDMNSNIPFILFTGKGWEEVAMHALNLGANKYIWKNEEPNIYGKKEKGVDQFEILANEIAKEVKKYETEKTLELTRRTIEKAKEGIFWITPEGEICYANKAVRDMLGYDQDELTARTIFDIDPDFDKEDRKEAWKELKKKGNRTFDTKHQAKDGTIFQVEITSNYIRHEDRELEFAFLRKVN